MNVFDYTAISDDAVRTEYKHLLRRSKSIAASVHRAYGTGKKTIETVYISGQCFNSYASETDDHYLIQLDSSIPLFSIILFGRLLSDPTVLPYLNTSGDFVSDYSLPAIADPADFSARREWKIGFNAIRSFAAGTLADICSTFVLCHEVGHVMSGHVEGLKHYEGEEGIAELTSYVAPSKTRYERRQAWEYDADAIASTLMIHFIAEMVENAKTHKKMEEIFGRADHTVEHTLSIAIVALFAFFNYMRGVRHKLQLKTTHPHPLVRAYCIRDLLVSAASARWDIDMDALERLVDERFEEFITAMEKIDLFDFTIFDRESLLSR